MSLDSIKWLMRHGIPIYLLDYDGTLLSSTLPSEPVNGPLKIAQMEAYKDPDKRLRIAKKLVEAKSRRTIDLLEWLGSRYDGLRCAQEHVQEEAQRIDKCNSLPRLMQVEGRIADIYWRQLSFILPKDLRFDSRLHETRQMNSSDPVNSLLNYGYAILESECRRALNSVGLEPMIGFLHEARQTKHPLVYDLQEPFRWLVDATIIESLESKKFGRKDFYRLDNYVLRIRPDAARRLLDILQTRFNATIRYRGKHYNWNTIVRLKCQELAGYILSKRNELDFSHPGPILSEDDSEAFRDQILSLSVAEARKLGIRKNTLWYVQHRARTCKRMRIYNPVKERLAQGSINQDERPRATKTQNHRLLRI
jgi:CRISPR-associated protein Cas1